MVWFAGAVCKLKVFEAIHSAFDWLPLGALVGGKAADLVEDNFRLPGGYPYSL